jgi:hypothetical protein
VKNGTTLPIKFVLRTDAGVLHTAQTVPGDGQYLENFHTKNYNLQTGAQYIVSVNDACSGTSLGSLTIQIYGKTPHGK